MMQIIAVLSMLIDHIGLIFFPDETVWRVVGRLAFPIYAYGIVIGLERTRNKRKYVKRLALIGLAAQIPYMWMVDSWKVNVIGTFLAVIGVLYVLERYRNPFFTGLALFAGLIILELVPFDYGGYALLLMLIYRYVPLVWTIAAHLALNLIYAVHAESFVQLFSVLATVVLVCAVRFPSWFERTRLPRWLWLSFYPAHMAVLMGIETLRQL